MPSGIAAVSVAETDKPNATDAMEMVMRLARSAGEAGQLMLRAATVADQDLSAVPTAHHAMATDR